MTLIQAAAASPHLLQGGWKTSDSNTKTTIIAALPPAKEPVTLRVTCVELVDSDELKFRFIVDGKQIIAPMNEGGSVFLEGTRIDVEQINTGVNFLATWESVRNPGPVSGFDAATWVVRPGGSGQSLVAAFAEPQAFVLEINRSSTGCRDGVMTVFVDGQQLTNQNGDLVEFLEGSSVVAYGSIISVVVTGTCDPNRYFSGRIKI